MGQRFAIKRLSAVEIDRTSSNQHELNAGRLRKELGFRTGTSRGPLSILIYTDNNVEPVLVEGEYTLYDSREDHPTRSPEYRLYYSSHGLTEYGQEGDLLALYREPGSDELRGVIARPGTSVEGRLAGCLSTRRSLSDVLSFVSPPPESSATAQELAKTLLPLEAEADLSQAARRHRLFGESVSAKRLPATREMATAGRQISEDVWGKTSDSDDFILHALEAETELFFEIERDVGIISLQEINQADAIDMDAVLSWALSIQQSRKSRRGQSLQHHFAALLERERIPYKSQCETERGERPDFIIPGYEAYHDPGYADDRLRLVACKTRVRERWGQVLKEGARVQDKYLLTVDEDLTLERLEAMAASCLTVFMPRRIIAENYGGAETGLIRRVADLVLELKRVL